MSNKVFINEIFESIQGEAFYIGFNQLFIRFTSCNLQCKYCDTKFSANKKEYSLNDLLKEVEKYNNVHSISLTGGEPLLEVDFLSEFLKLVDKKIYLETNGTLYNNLEKIIDDVDIISMDIKLPSCSGNDDLFDVHEKFIQVAIDNNKEIFIKVVFDENITDEEIEKTINLAQKDNLPLILQPKMDGDVLNIKSDFINKIFYKFVSVYPNVRLIPQVHKFLNVR